MLNSKIENFKRIWETPKILPLNIASVLGAGRAMGAYKSGESMEWPAHGRLMQLRLAELGIGDLLNSINSQACTPEAPTPSTGILAYMCATPTRAYMRAISNASAASLCSDEE